MSAPRINGPVRCARAGTAKNKIATTQRTAAQCDRSIRFWGGFRFIEFKPQVIVDNPIHRIARRNRQHHLIRPRVHQRSVEGEVSFRPISVNPIPPNRCVIDQWPNRARLFFVDVDVNPPSAARRQCNPKNGLPLRRLRQIKRDRPRRPIRPILPRALSVIPIRFPIAFADHEIHIVRKFFRTSDQAAA